MEEWLIIQNLFRGLNQQAKDHVDAAVGGSCDTLGVCTVELQLFYASSTYFA
jgi:hypothetical protein